ncbi:MAG: hypothetical protein JNM85_06910 [Chthonomonas sp.]|nr:hypothetical protein [Chthonomonas sp.]
MDAELWRFNLTKVVIIDVTDDYAVMQPPLPNKCYPVLRETYLPVYQLNKTVHRDDLVEGFMYDWHQRPTEEETEWVVGVVRGEFVREMLGG